MIAVREQVVRALVALLSGIEDGCGNRLDVERGRDTPVSQYPALTIEEGAERGREVSHGQLDLTMSVTIYGHVQVRAPEDEPAAAGPSLMAAITDLDARVRLALLAEPRQLGGIANDIRFLAMTPEIAEGGADRTGGFVAEYEVDYWTSSSNPFSQSIGG